VSGQKGGNIEIDVAHIFNYGKVHAKGVEEGGNIVVQSSGSFIETIQGELSVNSEQNGGSIHLESSGKLFSSGKHFSQGTHGQDKDKQGIKSHRRCH